MAEAALSSPPPWVRVASRVIQALPAGRYRAMNWVARRGATRFCARMPPELGGLLYECDLRDLLMREVCFTGRYEPQETALLQQLLDRGMTFVDVGANWGYFTLLGAHRVGASGRVLSVEADPRACRALRDNAARNRLAQVAIVNAAASDVGGTMTLGSYGCGSDESANFGVTSTTTVQAGGRSFTVSTRTLDEMLNRSGLDHVDLLKMDIEGAEARALAGMAERLGAARVDRLLVELHPAHLRDQGSSTDAVVGLLRSHGYQLWAIDHSAAAHRRAATMPRLGELLTPVSSADELGPWPHLLCARHGLSHGIV